MGSGKLPGCTTHRDPLFPTRKAFIKFEHQTLHPRTPPLKSRAVPVLSHLNFTEKLPQTGSPTTPSLASWSKRWTSNPPRKYSQERLTRAVVTGTMWRAAHPSGYVRCGAGAGCSAIEYQFLVSWVCSQRRDEKEVRAPQVASPN